MTGAFAREENCTISWSIQKENSRTSLGHLGFCTGAGGGTRTLTHSRAADFESAASAISPLRRNSPPHSEDGAGEGNRTLVASLEGWSSAIELRPLTKKPSFFGMAVCLASHLMAGSTGLEPATPGSTVQCANQLRHNPPVGEKRSVVYHIAFLDAREYSEKNDFVDCLSKCPYAPTLHRITLPRRRTDAHSPLRTTMVRTRREAVRRFQSRK